MIEENIHEQAYNAETFTEPQVHPDIDSYFRGKIAKLTELRRRLEKSKVRSETNWYPAGQWRENLEDFANMAIKDTSTEAKIQRLQEIWNAAVNGNFVDASAEVAQDLADLNAWIDEHQQSTDGWDQQDILRYNSLQAEIDEWQTSLRETPVAPSTRLGKQINRTVVGFIQQRDNTELGSLYMKLKPVQRAQKAITTLQQVPKGK